MENNYQFDVIDESNDTFGEVSSLIRHVYCRKYGAFLPGIYRNLIVLFQANQAVAALGFRCPCSAPFFLERYFDSGIESALDEKKIAAKIPQMVEIGHLVSSVHQGAPLLIYFTAKHLLENGYQWVIFTATEGLRKKMMEMDVELNHLVDAKRHQVGDEAEQASWGTYYDSNPSVVISNLQQMHDAMSCYHGLVMKKQLWGTRERYEA